MTEKKKASEYFRAAGKRHEDQHEITSDIVKHLAGEGLRDPAKLTKQQVQEVCGSVLAHLHRHGH